MQVNLQPAIDLIKKFEGCRLEAYRDPVGIWTIGYGTTTGVKQGMKITRERAEALLLEHVKRVCLPRLEEMVKVACTNNELCALVSLSYNIGTGALAGSTLIKKLNANKSDEEVADQFLRWNKAKGKVLPGLTRRRKAERQLFLTRESVNHALA